MILLCLETSTKACSVALGQDGNLLALKESADENYSHAENLTIYIDEVCRLAGIPLKKIDAVAAGKGPGSFTGLRIGVSAAKGLCFALDKPLIAVNSLETMAAGCMGRIPAASKDEAKRLFIPMIDAKRMEVYCAAYDESGKEAFPPSAEIIDENFLSKIGGSQYPLLNTQYLFFGDGAEKCRAILAQPDAVFIPGILPSAPFMIPIAKQRFEEKKFEDLAYFEPFYLKDFVEKKV